MNVGSAVHEGASAPSAARDEFFGIRILLVESANPERNALRGALRRRGTSVLTTRHDEAVSVAATWNPDLVLLDLGDEDAPFSIDETSIQELGGIPVIVMASPGDEERVVVALEMGAADFVIRPVDFNGLISRVRIALAKPHEPLRPQGDHLELGPLVFHLARRQVSVRGKSVHFPKREYDVLLALALQPRDILTRAELIDRIWGHQLSSTKTLNAHMLRIRHKVEIDAHHPNHIITVRGVGYYLDPGGPSE